MRRLLVSIFALALTAVGAPAAHAANGTLELVWRWPGEATVALPRGMALTSTWPTIQTDSEYAVVALSQRGKTYVAMSWFADHDWRWTVRDQPMPGGAVKIRALSDGPATLRVPVTGLRGTKRIALDKRFRDVSVTVRAFDRDPLVSVDVVEDVIPFDVPKHSVLVHAVSRPGLRVASAEGICTAPRGGTCSPGVETYSLVWSADWQVLHVDWDWGPGDAYAFFSDLMLAAGPAKHYLLWMSTA